MAFTHNTPGRSRHIALMAHLHDDSLLTSMIHFGPGVRVAAHDWNFILKILPTRPGYVAPIKTTVWDLPNDKGALVELGTSRLPLERHAAADVLWRLWGVEITEGFTHDPPTAHVAIKGFGQAFCENYLDQISVDFGKFLHNGFPLMDPTQFDSKACAATYFLQQQLFYKTKSTMLEFYDIFVAMYHEFVGAECNHPRPVDVPSGNWLEHIVAKRRAKWILPLSEQVAASKKAIDKMRNTCTSEPYSRNWYLLYAIYLLMPWWPMEWYMARYEASLTGLQDLVKHIIYGLITFSPVTHVGSETVTRAPNILLDIPFTTASIARQAVLLSLCKADIIRQHRALMASDSMAQWREDHPANDITSWPNYQLMDRLGDLDQDQPWQSTEAGDFSVLEACSIWWERLSTDERKLQGCHLCPTCMAIKWLQKLKAAGKKDPWTLSIPELVGAYQSGEEVLLGY